ncbi:DUF4129 domain-containing protein [Frondihabitans australicus]|uniref:Uncharacterized protein DUF4129 n=1 Tax=Frondihabitans australicus TaxID=386892 RepID=A0A495ID84_9MICO|nr:DUF4129 domain-containing protein [Frondihabitans australicus]RKR73271.1 uncharacterized protein DUF4129 [Frondihabitans australicus]
MSVPVTPSPQHARQLLEQELQKQEYQSAKPNALDRLSQQFFDWLDSIRFGTVHGTSAIAVTVLVVLIVAAALVLFRIYGLPRLQRRSAGPAPLFGDGDVRTADALRRSADAAAASGDFTTAVIERFRAIARDLDERGELSTSPGTTAHGFGERAAELFPSHADRLREAAGRFDGVRYLDRAGDADGYESVRRLDLDLARSTAVRAEAVYDGAGA